MINSLLVQAIPYDDETSASFLLRTAQLNGHSSIYQLFGKERFEYLTKNTPNCDLTDLPRFKLALDVLNVNIDYQKLVLAKAGPTSRSPRKWGELKIDDNLLKLQEFSYCPKCLLTEPFFRKIWLLKPIYACPIHSIFLIDQCSNCGLNIKLQKGLITHCPNCNFEYSQAAIKHCNTLSNIEWFMNILKEGDINFFHEFTSYWLAVENFAQLQTPLNSEDQLHITFEYFTNQALSIARLSQWINNRIELAHPRIQLLPFLKDQDKFYYYIQYIRLIEKNCNPYIQNSKSKVTQLLPSEAMLVLGIGRGKFKSLMKQDFLNLGKDYYSFNDFLSTDVEHFMISNNPKISQSKTLSNLNGSDGDTSQLCLNEVAEKLDINYETARKLVKTPWFNRQNQKRTGSSTKISHIDIESFDSNYIVASALAKKLAINPTNIVEKLSSLGITAISGPHIDKQPINVFSRSSIENIQRDEICGIEHYLTRAGRSKSKSKNFTEHNTSSLAEAANQLKIGQQQVAFLAQKGILTRSQIQPISIRIEKASVEALKNKTQDDAYISIENASNLLNCTLNWLIQYWCKTGFLEIEELVYWRLIKKSELDQVIKLKEEYLTGAEASALLGMRHSHITNLQKQGLIKPYYMGKTDKKIRLFKRSDVLKLMV
jgi:predicted RNA-binding Zn-ribbon protein involved in translation (DUF1610 family)